MSWRGVALVLALLIAGCASPASDPTVDPPISTVFQSTAMNLCQNEGSARCDESTVAVDSRGRIFVANGFGTELAISDDDGETWLSVPGPAPPLAGATIRDTDSLVRVTRDDRLVFSALVADYGPPARKLLGLHVAVSADGAQTWPVNRLISLDDAHMTVGADRQWTTDGPDGALYLAYSHFYADPVLGPAPLHPYVGNLVEVARSDDGGATWGPFVEISTRGDGTFAGGIEVTESGDLVVPTRRGPADRSTATLTLFRSRDLGLTWSPEPVAELPIGGRQPWPAFAAKPDGSEALAWTDENLRFATRPSPTASWSSPAIWSRAGETSDTMPAIVATATGWAVSYVTTRGQDPDRVGDFVLVEGNDDGPVKHTTLAADVPVAFRGANSDFATLASDPEGSLVVTVTLVQPVPGIDVYVVKPKA